MYSTFIIEIKHFNILIEVITHPNNINYLLNECNI